LTCSRLVEKKSLYLIQPEGSLLHSQAPNTCSYPQSVRSRTPYFQKIHLNIILRTTTRSTKRPLSFRFPHQHSCCKCCYYVKSKVLGYKASPWITALYSDPNRVNFRKTPIHVYLITNSYGLQTTHSFSIVPMCFARHD